MSNSFVAFYDEQGIVPVRQIDVGTNQHVTRRCRLYQTLGVPLEMIHNKQVLEVGAGTGDNATVNLMFKPKMYTFLDSSEEVLAFLNTRFKRQISAKKVSIKKGDLNSFNDGNSYDFVIAEACIPGQKNPLAAISNLANLVNERGFLIVTTQSANSLLAELCRRVLSRQLKEYSTDIHSWHKLCLEFFASDLNLLAGMSRKPEDWVWDVLIHPWHKSQHVFEALELLEAIKSTFQVVGTSPNWAIRDHWYKLDHEKFSLFQQEVVSNYESANLLFLDKNESMSKIWKLNKVNINRIRILVNEFYIRQQIFTGNNKISSSELERLWMLASEIASELQGNLVNTSRAISDFVTLSKEISQTYINGKNYLSETAFTHWWGRGMQYIAFQKCS